MDVKNVFNSIADKYDFMNTLMSFGMDRFWRKKVVRISGAGPDMKVLDVCCGTGRLTRELGEALAGSGTVTGLDFSEKMLEGAREYIKDSAAKEHITFLQGNALDLPFKDNSFDCATVGWGLRNLPDLNQGLREMYRVVKSGSVVVSIDMGKPTVPIFKQIYWLYFKKMIPLMGKIWAEKKEEYQYLYQSAMEFKSQSQLVDVFQECGFVRCKYTNLAGGAVAIVFGEKP